MRISSERLARLRARMRGGARSAAKGGKGSLVAGGVGAASYYVATLAGEKVEFLRSHPLALPAAMAVAGHFVKRKNHDAGTALIGAAGFAGAMAFAAQKNGQAKGFDAGALIDASAYPELGEAGSLRLTSSTSDTHPEAGDFDAGALVDAGDVDRLGD